jgi:hypothetical protein
MDEGQAAAKRGDRAMARELLTQLVDKDPHNEEAWLWLSGVVADFNEQQICLENALVINPSNEQARKGLQYVVAKTGNPSRMLAAPSVPAVPSAPTMPTMPDEAVEQAAAPEMPEPFEAPGAAETPTLPEWMQNLPTGQPAAAEGAGTDAPQSWAIPGPVPADPYVATAPYPAPEGATNEQTNGHAEAVSGTMGDMAVTVPYTAPEPAATDMPFVGGAVSGMSAMDNDQTGPMSAADLHGYAAANGNGNGNGNGSAAHMAEASASDMIDEKPFVPPPGDEAYLSTGDPDVDPTLSRTMLASPENTDTDLPSWLEGLTPSDPTGAHVPAENGFSPFDMSSMPPSNVIPMTSAHDPNMPFGAPDPSQVGPYSAMRLPSPHELPGDDGRSNAGSGQSQPWYLQSGGGSSAMAPPMPTGGISSYLDSTMLSGAMAGAALLEDDRASRPGATIECPNCKEQVPETSLACPNCHYNFFVNCPHCHELVDTGDAVPEEETPCPYCKAVINKMEMGMGGVTDLVSQKNPGSRPAAANSTVYPAMKQTAVRAPKERRPLSFNWVVDLLWLIAIVMMVWALTQLPTWLNLSGMY